MKSVSQNYVLLIQPASSGVSYIVRDDFTDTVSAGSVNGTNATPGPGVRVVVDAESKLSLSSGVMNMAPRGTPTTGDPRIHYTVSGAALARAAGLTLMGLARPTATNTSFRLVGWDTDTTGEGLHILNLNSAGALGNLQQGLNASYMANEWIYGAIVLRSAGCHFLAKGGGNSNLSEWSRLWVRVVDTNTPLYPAAYNSSATYTQEYVRVAQLSSPWTDAAAGGTITSTNNVNDTFTHETSFLLYATVTLPSSGQIEIRFHIQDANNYWRLLFTSAGAYSLDIVTAGTPAVRASGTGVTNGMRFCFREDLTGEKYLHKGENGNSGAGTLLNTFKSSTDGLIADLGTGGAITSLEVYQWTLSGIALSQVSAMNHSTFTGWQIDSASMPLASSRLTIPNTGTGGNANQVVHPTIYDAGEGSTWNGYRYWMAICPYPESDYNAEQPQVYVSDDLSTWIEPPGISNPVAPFESGSVRADPDFIMAGSRLWMMYLETDHYSGATYARIYGRYSDDGINWSAKQLILDLADDDIVSPSIIYDGSQYVMYSLNINAGYKIQRRTCTTVNGTWSAATTLATLRTPLSDPQVMWHLDVTFDSEYGYLAFITLHTTAEYYFLASSPADDGIIWRVAENPLVHLPATGWDNGWLYRAAFASRTSGGFKIIYSAKSDDGAGDWGAGLTELTIGAL